MHYYLILDTSSEYTLIGVAAEGKIVSSHVKLHENQLSRTLLPTIDACLKEVGLSMQEIDHIGVGNGPGSYTGTRIGVAVAKSLAFGLKIPLRSFPSLLAFLPHIPNKFGCVMPAKTGDFFLLKGDSSEEGINITFSGLVSKDLLMKELEDLDGMLGKPLAELEEKLGPVPVPWISPLPNLSSPLRFLATPRSGSEERVDLIYLHHP